MYIPFPPRPRLTRKGIPARLTEGSPFAAVLFLKVAGLRVNRAVPKGPRLTGRDPPPAAVLFLSVVNNSGKKSRALPVRSSCKAATI